METERQQHARSKSMLPCQRGGLLRTEAMMVVGPPAFPAPKGGFLSMLMVGGKEVFLQPR
jgi:hypothetical protein